MNDSKLKSASETGLNIGVGFWINMGLNSILFPIYGLPFNLVEYAQIGGFYTFTSLTRQYGFRRVFNKIWKKQPVKGSIAEVFVNSVVGYGFNLISGLIILPFFGIHSVVDISVISLIGSLFTAARQFAFRRLFNYFGPKENLYTLTIRFLKWLKK